MEAVKVVSQLKEVKSYLRSVFNHCINSVNPKALVSKELLVQDNELIVRGNSYQLAKNCYVVGFGKAVVDMARATQDTLQSHLKSGVLSIPEGFNHNFIQSHIEVFKGAKDNVPDINAENAARRIIELAASLKADDNLIVLISGGGSALFPYPTPPVTLNEKQELTNMLQNKGATIVELNSVRKKLSQVKGGKLAKLAFPANVISLILSDIVGDPLDYIASGPTVPDFSLKYVSIDILKKYGVYDKAPSSVIEVLSKEDTEDRADFFINTKNFIIGNNSLALSAAQNMAVGDGYMTLIMTNTIQGRVESVSHFLAKFCSLVCQVLTRIISRENFALEMYKIQPMLCLSDETVVNLTDKLYLEPTNKLLFLFGGETSVEVKGAGKGGRNQELALRFSQSIDEMAKTMHLLHLFDVVILCGGTDGFDGPTDAAGALSYNGQIQLAQTQGMDCTLHITENDSYNYFAKLNNGEDHIKIGHTGTNVMDITMITIQPKM